MSLLRRHLSPLTQFLAIAILAVFVGVAILAWPVIGKNVADPAGRVQPAPSDEARGTFKPTKEQWAGFKIEPVRLVSFRPEQVTEGKIAIDDDLTTPVFSPYSGRVIKLIAKLGDHVEPGAPLFAVEASEFVQAQNDLITALAALQDRARAAHAGGNQREARARALSGARRRAEGLAAGPDRSGRPRRTPSAATRSRWPRCATGCASSARATRRSPRSKRSRRRSSIRSRSCGADRRHRDAAPGRARPVHQQRGRRRVRPGLHDRRSVDRLADRQCARGGCAADARRRAGRGARAGLSRPRLQREDLLGRAVDRSEHAPPAGARRRRESRRRAEAGDVRQFQHHHRRRRRRRRRCRSARSSTRATRRASGWRDATTARSPRVRSAPAGARTAWSRCSTACRRARRS